MHRLYNVTITGQTSINKGINFYFLLDFIKFKFGPITHKLSKAQRVYVKSKSDSPEFRYQ